MLKIKTWNIEAMTGYKPKTTFYEDFSIKARSWRTTTELLTNR